MKTNAFVFAAFLFVACVLLALIWAVDSIASGEAAAPPAGPRYTADRLLLPEN